MMGFTDIVRGTDHPHIRDWQGAVDLNLPVCHRCNRMNQGVKLRDLLVLVADLDIEHAIQGLLSRTDIQESKSISFDIRRHPNRDSGCRAEAVNYLRPFLNTHHHALVIFDRDGCGSSRSRTEIQQEVESDLDRNGWEGRSKVIVIDPELEIWVWSDSPLVSEVLGWGSSFSGLRDWLRSRRLWSSDLPKPEDPKKAMLEAMAKGGLPKRARRSPAKFYQLAKTVNFTNCRDPALNDLKRTLRTWFPAVDQ